VWGTGVAPALAIVGSSRQSSHIPHTAQNHQDANKMKEEHFQDHYKILGLPSPCVENDLTPHDIKLAYRRALLYYHPDKSRVQFLEKAKPAAPGYTVDQIADAYKTLIDPKRRSEYDRSVRLGSLSTGLISERSRPGLETMDLDDLAFDEEHNTWYHSCRCGNGKGFRVGEEELEKDAEHGEVITGCRGCSLWLRVTFAMVEDG
jgi:diphthamide biosynthesis protein 4